MIGEIGTGRWRNKLFLFTVVGRIRRRCSLFWRQGLVEMSSMRNDGGGVDQTAPQWTCGGALQGTSSRMVHYHHVLFLFLSFGFVIQQSNE